MWLINFWMDELNSGKWGDLKNKSGERIEQIRDERVQWPK